MTKDQLELPIVDDAMIPPVVIERQCGCQYEGGDGPPYAISQCAPCAAESEMIENRSLHVLDHEMDVLVHAAAGGKRVRSIRGPDPTRGR